MKRGWERKGWVVWALGDFRSGRGIGWRIGGFLRIDVHSARAERVDEPGAETRGLGHCAGWVVRRDDVG